MPRKFHKHKLLLDEGFHLRQRLPILNSRFNLKHVAADYKKSALPDAQVYELACKEDRLLITYNTKDFTPLIEKGINCGVIGISTNLSLEHIDKKLTALLMHSTEKALFGKLTMLTEETDITDQS